MSERLDIRLSEEEKKRLAELAKQKGVSMTDLVRVWIVRGDVVHVLSEQLQDILNDFAKWHVLHNTNTSILYLCLNLRNRMDTVQDATKRTMIYKWTAFFDESFRFMRDNISDLTRRLSRFISKKEPKEKEILINLIIEFSKIVVSYHNVFVEGFMNILQNMGKNAKRDIGDVYNDEFRTRYNEIASKYEDFLKRVQRELGGGLEQAIPRAREFRAK